MENFGWGDRFVPFAGGIAQLVERLVRNEKVRGSNPLTSTIVEFLTKSVEFGALTH